ncbi:hypothetical protein ACHAWU_000032 [Discostella pseudostelligera]|uniref:Uncharacterized protein n=1 Tax=Discostella pseudostelligera TaxID=259834 RepID=A0ABD3MAS0_9STRA
MMTKTPTPPNDFDNEDDNSDTNNDDNNVDTASNYINNDTYKGATLFGLEPKNYNTDNKASSSSSAANNHDGGGGGDGLLDNTIEMQYTSIVIFVLSCYVTFMLFFGDVNDNMTSDNLNSVL